MLSIWAAGPAFATRALRFHFWLAAGMTIAKIVAEYPGLTEESIRGTLAEIPRSDLVAQGENPSRRNMPESLVSALGRLGELKRILFILDLAKWNETLPRSDVKVV